MQEMLKENLSGGKDAEEAKKESENEASETEEEAKPESTEGNKVESTN